MATPGLITPPVRFRAQPATVSAQGTVTQVVNPPLESGWPRNPYNMFFPYIISGTHLPMARPEWHQAIARSDGLVSNGLNISARSSRKSFLDLIRPIIQHPDNVDRLLRHCVYRNMGQLSKDERPINNGDYFIRRLILTEGNFGFCLRDRQGKYTNTRWSSSARYSAFYTQFLNWQTQDYLDKDGQNFWRRIQRETLNNLTDGNASEIGQNGNFQENGLEEELYHGCYWDICNETAITPRADRCFGTITEIIDDQNQNPLQYRVNLNYTPNVSKRRNTTLAPDGMFSDRLWQGLVEAGGYDPATGILTLVNNNHYRSRAQGNRAGQVGDEIWIGEGFTVTGDYNGDGSNESTNNNQPGGGGRAYREGMAHAFNQLEAEADELGYPVAGAKIGNGAADMRRRFNGSISFPMNESEWYGMWDQSLFENANTVFEFDFGVQNAVPHDRVGISKNGFNINRVFAQLQGAAKFLKPNDSSNLRWGRPAISVHWDADGPDPSMGDRSTPYLLGIEARYLTMCWCIDQMVANIAHGFDVGLRYPLPIPETVIFCGRQIAPDPPHEMGTLVEFDPADRKLKLDPIRGPDWGEAGYNQVFNVHPDEWRYANGTKHYRVCVSINMRVNAFGSGYNIWDPEDPTYHPSTDTVKDKVILPAPMPGRKWVAFDENNYVCPYTGRTPILQANGNWNDGHDATPNEYIPPVYGRAWLEVDI